MAVLINKSTRLNVYLQANHIFGRNPSIADTQLSTPAASRIHAVIMWDGKCWLLKDSSQNGTFINGKRAEHGVPMPLCCEDEIYFANDSVNCWVMNDVSPPISLLYPVTPETAEIPLNDIVALPSEQAPEVTLYQSSENQWVMESITGILPLKTGDLITVGHRVWRFHDARPCINTLIFKKDEMITPDKISLYFDVSQDEEHVSLKLLLSNDKEVDLGERTHHYLLLLLARHRLFERERLDRDKCSNKDQGWINKEELSRMTGLNEYYLNTQIYRFRKQVSALLPEEKVLNHMIERRPGDIRLISGPVYIQGGSVNLAGQ